MSDDEDAHSYPPSIPDTASISSLKAQKRRSWASSRCSPDSSLMQGRRNSHRISGDPVDLMQALKLSSENEAYNAVQFASRPSIVSSSSSSPFHHRFSLDSDSHLSSLTDARRASFVSSVGSDKPLLPEPEQRTKESGQSQFHAFNWKGKQRQTEVGFRRPSGTHLIRQDQPDMDSDVDPLHGTTFSQPLRQTLSHPTLGMATSHLPRFNRSKSQPVPSDSQTYAYPLPSPAQSREPRALDPNPFARLAARGRLKARGRNRIDLQLIQELQFCLEDYTCSFGPRSDNPLSNEPPALMISRDRLNLLTGELDSLIREISETTPDFQASPCSFVVGSS